MSIPVPLLLLLLVCSLLAFMVIFFVSGKSSNKKKRYMDIIQNKGESLEDSAETKAAKKKNTPQSIAKRLKGAAERSEGQRNKKSLAGLISQAGFETSVLKFWVYSLLFGTVLSGLIITTTGFSPFVKGLLIFSSYFGLPRFFLKWKARRRQNAFLQDFANALEDMIRLLKAGMPISEAISMVAREYSGPLGEEMQSVYEAQRLGVSLPEAVQKIPLRIPLPEVQMFATAITIQVQTGSSLSEVLGNLSGVIRGRYALKRKVQALSSEAKISAGIIGSVPFALTGILYLVNRDYIMLLFNTETGNFLLSCAIGWMSLGVLVMRQMINFKV